MEELKRLFIAAPLPQEISSALQDYAKTNFADVPVRLMDKDQLHLTFLFLGDMPIEQVPIVQEAFAGVCVQSPCFSLPLLGTAVQPDEEHPRLIWAEFEATPQFLDLSEKLRATFASYLRRKTRHEPRAHITLARFARDAQPTTVSLPELSLPDLSVSSLELFSSSLTGEGAQHTLLNTCHFTTD